VWGDAMKIILEKCGVPDCDPRVFQSSRGLFNASCRSVLNGCYCNLSHSKGTPKEAADAWNECVGALRKEREG